MIRKEQVPHWYLSPRFLIGKVQEMGIAWCAHEAFRFTRPIRAKLWSVPDKIRYSTKKQSDVLYAFYDLAVSPATFDIVHFLVLAELERKEVGCSSMHVVIVPGPSEGFRKGSTGTYHESGTWDYDADYMHWRLRNILVPCCWLIPSCKQLTVCTSREEAMVLEASLVTHVFPKKERNTIRHPQENYNYSHIVASMSHGFVLPSIQPKPQACRYISNWLQANADNRKVITITLRESSYEQDRNSNLKDWAAFVRSLDSAVYFPVIIRDTESALEPIPPELNGLTIFAEIPWNLELRAALYKLSYLNMFTSGGPAILAILNHQTRYLMFKIITSSCVVSAERHLFYIGINLGSQFKHATLLQRLVWEDDTLEVIQREFKDMCDRIESSSTENIDN